MIVPRPFWFKSGRIREEGCFRKIRTELKYKYSLHFSFP
jgi:hypothetical protein